MWRTPHPDPNPLDGSTTGLSGAIAVAMAYLPDGTVIFTERPHPLADGIPNNPLIVDVSTPKSYSSIIACFPLVLSETVEDCCHA